MADKYLFEKSLLDSPRFQSIFEAHPHLEVRPLSLADYDRGFIDLLSHHVFVGDISQAEFTERFESMKAKKGTYYVTVLYDRQANQVIGSATLVIEEKFIFQRCKHGLVEDVVVRREHRGKGYGKLLMATLVELSGRLDSLYTSLECDDFNKPFYEKFGFQREAHFMILWNKPCPES